MQKKRKAPKSSKKYLVDPTVKRLRVGNSYIQSAPSAPFGWRNSADEVKYLDTNLATGVTVCDTTGSVTCLNLLAQGDDNTNRQGRVIQPKSIRVRGLIQPIDSNIGANLSRCILVWDNNPNSATIATITNILASSTSFAHPNLDNRGRFTILRDDSYPMGESSDTATVARASYPSCYYLDWYVKLKGRVPPCVYSGTTATIGSISQGALLFVTIGDETINNGGLFAGISRLRFEDN